MRHLSNHVGLCVLAPAPPPTLAHRLALAETSTPPAAEVLAVVA